MKVSDVGAHKDIDATKRKKKAAGKGGEFLEELKHAAAETVAEPTGTPVVSAVGAALAAQEVPDAGVERSRGLVRRYGEDLLDHLDGVRHGLLVGAVPKDKLAGLAHKMRQRRQESDDPKLNEIIDEIELRAEVEIAKLTRDV